MQNSLQEVIKNKTYNEPSSGVSGPQSRYDLYHVNNHQVSDPNTWRGKKEPEFSRQNPSPIFLFGSALNHTDCSPCFLTEQDEVFINTYILIREAGALICKITFKNIKIYSKCSWLQKWQYRSLQLLSKIVTDQNQPKLTSNFLLWMMHCKQDLVFFAQVLLFEAEISNQYQRFLVQHKFQFSGVWPMEKQAAFLCADVSVLLIHQHG